MDFYRPIFNVFSIKKMNPIFFFFAGWRRRRKGKLRSYGNQQKVSNQACGGKDGFHRDVHKVKKIFVITSR
jgi:hypothetical protein